jgi:hypothetical protein
MDARLNWETVQFNSACNALKKKLGDTVTFQRIIEYEVAKIIQATMERTKTATDITIFKTAKIPWRTWDLGHGLKKYYLLNRYSDAMWEEMQHLLLESLMRKLATRGLSRRAWLELGIRVNPTMTADTQVRRAVSPKGHTGAENVTVSRSAQDAKFTLMVQNRSPLIRWSNGDRAFFSAVRGRRIHMEKALAHGCFSDMAKMAKSFKGLVVTVPPAPGP